MIFIKYNIPSSKNSKIKGRFFSKTVQKFLRSYGIQSFSSRKKEVIGYKTIPMTFPVNELKELFKDIDYPLIVGMHFVRGTRHKCDFGNLQQILADLFTAFDIIPDDNMDYFFAVPLNLNGEFYSYNKENPGVFIKILNNDNR